MRIFIGMETSGTLRSRFADAGHEVLSCDLLPAQDGCGFDPIEMTGHKVGDVFDILDRMKWAGCWPDLAIFHPTCTYLTLAAAWAFKDADYVKYPGVGYHQRIKAGTLTGEARRQARDAQIDHVDRLWELPIKSKIIENPLGFLSTMWRPHSQIVQPYECGDDASKKTCFWIDGLPLMEIDPSWRLPGRITSEGKERWSNQTDSGQNNATPNDYRWQHRSKTFPKMADMIVYNYGKGRRK